ncbi:MAG: AarF/ABC1/UbiB kinase family protein [Anaerolineae bacterium]|nr:AarF/ABC1/UbiB kinase family protein [Anaerolineae bacterium]
MYMMRSPQRHLKHLRRYREIVRVLIRHGFGGLVDQLGLLPALSLPRRLLSRGPVGPPLSAPEHVRLAIEELGPTFIKLGQILSTRPDLIPPAYIRELIKLQDTVPPADGEAIKARVEAELEGTLEELFVSFEAEPLAAASLAQVHAATLPGGQEVVVKVQRPGIEELISVDLEILFDLARLVQERTPLGELYDLPEIAEGFAFTLRAELDFRREGRNADRFRRNFADEPALYIPRVYWEYTTSRVLVLERIRGIKIGDIEALDAAGVDRHRVGENAARIILKQVLEDGFFHADPHPGNFFVMDGAIIGAMDFGMVGHISPALRSDLTRLYVAFVDRDSEAVVEQFLRMGAVGYQVDRAKLQRDLERLLDKYYGLPLKEIRAQEVMEDVLPIAFRHHLHFPPDLWLLEKTLVMMEGVGLRLAPDFNIFDVVGPHVRRMAWQMVSPHAWGRRLVKGIGDWGELFAGLPRQAPRILDRLEHGQLEFILSLKETDRAIGRLDRIGNRLAISILIAALIVSMALLMPLVAAGGRGFAFWLLVVGFLIAAFLGLMLLLSIWRAGRQRRR